MHFLIFWGTLFVFLGKGIRLFSPLTGLTAPPQGIYLFASSISEIGGGLILLGGVMAVVRRFVIKPSRLDSKPDDHLKYLWAFVILLTGYLVKGYRLALAGGGLPADSFSWAPISFILSRFMLILPSEPLNELLVWHRVLIHAIPAVAFFGYIVVSRSSLEHIYLSALNVFYRSLKPRGAVRPIPNFEEAETYGVSEIKEFTWKQLLDLEACTRCGRCQDQLSGPPDRKTAQPEKGDSGPQGPPSHQGREPSYHQTTQPESEPSPLVGEGHFRRYPVGLHGLSELLRTMSGLHLRL